MLRAGRFKHRLLDDDFLKNQSAQAYKCLQGFFPLWQQKRLSDPEIAAIYIFIFSFLRRPQDFLGGPHNLFPLGVARDEAFLVEDFLELLRAHLPTPLADAKILNRLPTHAAFLPAFCALSWRSIPLSVARSLLAWENKIYPLVLQKNVPSPADVLRMQAQGSRCISMLVSLEEMQSFVAEGRDVLGFIVHDLIHADHFFADPEKAQAQILFCQKLELIQKSREIRAMLARDEIFRKEFEYLMSDMNSVPLHLLKTLKAVLLGYFKRREGVSMNGPLSMAGEQEFTHLYGKALEPWKFAPEALLAAQRLNTPLYQGQNDAELLHRTLCINDD
ncbi:MAG: hypothetical protein HUU57_09915 [Bdellovibrio sp.]|nr:hypothetical protein [Bdellovibrio sp.]